MKRIIPIKTAVLMIVIATLFTFTPFALGDAMRIRDIEGYWAEAVIKEWVDKGLVHGYADGTFRPQNAITRAEFITLVNQAFGFKEKFDLAFIDVSKEDWYYDAVAIAATKGYIKGSDLGEIKPLDPITREEVSVILTTILQLSADESQVSNFKDVTSMGAWSRGSIGAIAKAGYMKGYPDKTFGPKKNIQRGEAVVALNNVLNGQKRIEATIKQDFFGITYVYVNLGSNADVKTVKVANVLLELDKVDGKWKGTVQHLKIGEQVTVTVTSGKRVYEKEFTVETL